MIAPGSYHARRSLSAVPVAVAVLAAFLLASCSPGGDADPTTLSRSGDRDDAVFLTLDATPDAWMDALYEGPVRWDAAGCLRLESSDRHTVVWPVGFDLVRRGGQLRVVDAEGREVGQIGGTFRLTGGEVPSLHDGVPMSAETRAEAERRCPGRYWIVGEVLPD